MASKNNVQVSGCVFREDVATTNTTQIMVGIENLKIPVLVNTKEWEHFKEQYPDNYTSITVSGELKKYWNDARYEYMIKAGDACSLNCFHNVLQGYLDESKIQFQGVVRLKGCDPNVEEDGENQKSEPSRLYLKRLIFETDSQYPVSFEAIALRKVVPYFEEIKEGSRLFLKADYIVDREGYPPYWKVKAIPKVIQKAS